jgi:hypothetical protein
LNGLVIAMKQGDVTVTAILGAMTGKASLTVGPPDTTLLTAPRGLIPVVPIAFDGQIPADFSVPEAMKSFYGNFDPSMQSSVSAVAAGAEENTFFKGAKGIEVRPYFVAMAKDSGASKVFLSTYAGPLGQGYGCHGCAPLIGMAEFAKVNAGWSVESSTKAAVFFGEWGQPPETHILRIGPERVGVELDFESSTQGQFIKPVSILIPWKGEIRKALSIFAADSNKGQCGDEGMLPCYENHEEISFVKGPNPGYDDIVLTLTGTALTEKPPYEVVEVSETERRTFFDGKYMLAPR